MGHRERNNNRGPGIILPGQQPQAPTLNVNMTVNGEMGKMVLGPGDRVIVQIKDPRIDAQALQAVEAICRKKFAPNEVILLPAYMQLGIIKNADGAEEIALKVQEAKDKHDKPHDDPVHEAPDLAMDAAKRDGEELKNED